MGGIEYATDFVGAMDLARLEAVDSSLGHFLKDLRGQMNMWKEPA